MFWWMKWCGGPRSTANPKDETWKLHVPILEDSLSSLEILGFALSKVKHCNAGEGTTDLA